MEIEKILNRSEYAELLDNNNFKALKDKKVLITGANGSIGTLLFNRLLDICDQIPGKTDKHNMDITNPLQVKLALDKYNPDIIIHLAGAKHAPQGEIDINDPLDINLKGTINLLEAKAPHTKLILASTCKACNPETVYGATKLIAERHVLNNGGSVARFYNVVETSGNVFEIWENCKGTKEVVTSCNRYFISKAESVGLLLYTAIAEPGRYSVNTLQIHSIEDIFNRIYKETYSVIYPRRGDRVTELRMSTSEYAEKTLLNETIVKVKSYHDL